LACKEGVGMINYTVEAWEVLFCKVDEDGELLEDIEGRTQLFIRKGRDSIQYLTSGVEEKDLINVNLRALSNVPKKQRSQKL
jgi:hypothetical protein